MRLCSCSLRHVHGSVHTGHEHMRGMQNALVDIMFRAGLSAEFI